MIKILFLPFVLILTIICGCMDNSTLPSPENVKKGEHLFNDSGCTKCHSVNGDTLLYGPNLRFAPNTEIIVFSKGIQKSITPDRKYFVRSIKEPDAEKPAGYQDKIMPATTLTDEEINLIADYLIDLNSGK